MTKLQARAFFAMFLTSIVFLAITLSACSKPEEKKEVKQDTKKEEVGVIKIGAILPLTGPIAWLGVNIKNGIDVALDELRSSKQQANVEVFFEDSRGKPSEAVTLANKALNINKADLILVLGTGPVNAVLPIADNYDKLLFGFTIHPGITEKSNNLFRIYISGDQEWATLAKYINETGIKKIGIMHINAEYGIDSETLLRNYLQAGTNIVFSEAYEIGQSDFRSILSKIKNKDAEAIVLMGYGKEYLPLLKQMREMNIRTKVLGNIDFVYDFVRNESVADGAVFVAPEFSFGRLTKRGETFVGRFEKKFGRKPSWDEAYGYDTVMLISKAFAIAGSKKTANLRNTILDMKMFDGASGKMIITKSGDTKTPMAIATLKGKKIVRY